MGKTFFLIWLTFNPNHTANLSYMGGHQYATEAACMAVSETFNAIAGKAMERTTEEELPEMEFNCTPFAPPPSGNVLVVDVEYLADEELFLKVE